jgi:protein-S-isoprenylcysteine O-methyltransferase Ste14
MRRAAFGSLLFLAVAPGVVAGFVPWLLTHWHGHSLVALRVLGWILLAAGAAVLVQAFGRFVFEGIGTPAPVAPTQKLVVGGPYRYVRNVMYLAVGATIVGQALIFGSWTLLGYAVAFFVVVAAFVHWHEEPTLRTRFGAEYEEYLRTVPGWWPRSRG